MLATHCEDTLVTMKGQHSPPQYSTLVHPPYTHPTPSPTHPHYSTQHADVFGTLDNVDIFNHLSHCAVTIY